MNRHITSKEIESVIKELPKIKARDQMASLVNSTQLLTTLTQAFPGSSATRRICLQCRRPPFHFWSGRSAGEGIGYPLQYSWASLVAQLVKNPSTMWETWVRSLGWEDPQEKETATHSSILAWRIPWTVQSMESQRVGHD